MQNLLEVVEKVGTKVPHPAVIFLALIAIVVALLHALIKSNLGHEDEGKLRQALASAQATT